MICKDCIHYNICIIRNDLHQSNSYKYMEEYGCSSFIEKQGVYRTECFGKNLHEIARALEKQEKQRPKIKFDDYDDGKFVAKRGMCPHCYTIVTKGENYCFRCGQRIDWSEKGGLKE